MTKKTFGDLDGKELKFQKCLNRPLKRSFAFHAVVARREAVNQGFIKSEEEVVIDESMWSNVAMEDSVISSWLESGRTYV